MPVKGQSTAAVELHNVEMVDYDAVQCGFEDLTVQLRVKDYICIRLGLGFNTVTKFSGIMTLSSSDGIDSRLVYSHLKFNVS